jgi:hypothetical protein
VLQALLRIRLGNWVRWYMCRIEVSCWSSITSLLGVKAICFVFLGSLCDFVL